MNFNTNIDKFIGYRDNFIKSTDAESKKNSIDDIKSNLKELSESQPGFSITLKEKLTESYSNYKNNLLHDPDSKNNKVKEFFGNCKLKSLKSKIGKADNRISKIQSKKAKIYKSQENQLEKMKLNLDSKKNPEKLMKLFLKSFNNRQINEGIKRNLEEIQNYTYITPQIKDKISYIIKKYDSLPFGDLIEKIGSKSLPAKAAVKILAPVYLLGEAAFKAKFFNTFLKIKSEMKLINDWARENGSGGELSKDGKTYNVIENTSGRRENEKSEPVFTREKIEKNAGKYNFGEDNLDSEFDEDIEIKGLDKTDQKKNI